MRRARRRPRSTPSSASSRPYARGEAAACVLDLRKIERFITLHVPKVEDGNNFGVAIQLEVAKLVKETGKECKSY